MSTASARTKPAVDAVICIGSRVALTLAPRRDCVGAVCLAAPILEQALWTRATRSRLGSRLRSQRALDPGDW